MIHPGAIALFKNRPCFVSAIAEGKLLVETGEPEPRRLREKDLFLVHPGPVPRLPRPREGGDFATAYEMLAPEGAGGEAVATTWRELSELVFGRFEPEDALACVLKALEGGIFRLEEGLPVAASRAELAQARRREEEKAAAAAERSAFSAWLREAIRKGSADPAEAAAWRKHASEIEKLALGQVERSPLAREAGIKETREAAHRALVASGLWPGAYNPWPQRAGCALWPPRLSFPAEDSFPDGRLDLRGLSSYAIDSAWSKDPDDAVGFDGERIWVHVADPAAYLLPGSEPDIEAMARGATLYLPERIVPMLPEEAVSRLGLGLAETSPALSFGFRLDPEGGLAETTIARSLVSVKRLSYEGADELLSAGDPGLVALKAAADLRLARRLANGAVDIDLPEVSMAVDGDEVRFVPIRPTLSSALVREMMLLAGEGAARWAWERRLPFVFASQEAPQLPDDLPRFDRGEGSPSLHYRRRRGMRAGVFGPELLAHRGLGLSFYSQVTSPLRRYQDLLAHHQIGAALSGGGAEPLSSEEIGNRCLLAARGAAAARQAERDSRLHWTICHLGRHPDWRAGALILEPREEGAWIVVPELGLECPLRTRLPLESDALVQVKVGGLDLANLEVTLVPA